LLEEGREGHLWLDGDDALLVQPNALEDEGEELALGGGVALLAPEDRKVLEHPLGLVEVGDRAGRARGQLCVDRIAASHVLGPRDVAQLIEVTGTTQALFQSGAPLGGFRSLSGSAAGEAAEDLLADRRSGPEVTDELDELLLDDVGMDEGLIAGMVGAAGGAVIVRDELASDGGALHLALAALAAGETAQQVALGGSAGLQRACALVAHSLHPVEQRLVDDWLV
jgi:hypothetical protein